MKLFSVALAMTAIASSNTVNAALGSACVESVLVKVFNAINEIRTAGATATYAKSYIDTAGVASL